jgi:putative oxidoreductase
MNATGVLHLIGPFLSHRELFIDEQYIDVNILAIKPQPNMKVTPVIARFLLGSIFLVFGLNGFLHFIPASPPPSGTAGQFVGALLVSNYLVVVFLFQLISAVLLLINRYVPLALTLLAPIIANILLFHILMAPNGLALAIIVTVLWIATFLNVRSAFGGLLQPRVPAQGLR